MNINPISFGITYLEPSYKNIDPSAQKKIEPLYSILNKYAPNDVVLGANSSDDLKVKITRGSLTEYLLANGRIPNNEKNKSLCNLEKALNKGYAETYGKYKYPIKEYAVHKLNIKDTHDIAQELIDNVNDYNKEFGHLFDA